MLEALTDWGGLAALLAVLGAGIKWLFDQAKGSGREADLSKREMAYRQQMEVRLSRIERSHGVLLGAVHVIVDEIKRLDPDSPALPLVAAQLGAAFPEPEDMPSDLLALMGRLSASRRK
ncbi:hypothetical protein CHH26_11300 [Qipengyuania flava]|uniref:hypothetical protein n=1 Tax=Qipengyuania flava TaxID=192812 RepID=UPI000B8C5719|nr:hypothetical protein [Qipengyuania flava]ASP30747.1 hypothetical protein CHH26_11300 [Qipengyuania flava]